MPDEAAVAVDVALHRAAGARAAVAGALGKPIITLHPANLGHMLKEVNATALASCREPEQVVQALAYVVQGAMPSPMRDDFVPFIERADENKPQS